MTHPTTLSSPAAPRARAFTLIELLIVVAIISILSSIAVPNFLEAQTRAKVARVKNDQRTMIVGLEAYKVDTNRYPPRTRVPAQNPVLRGFGDALLRAEEIGVLTSPIAYLSSLPTDVFERTVAPPNALIDYWSGRILDPLSTRSVEDDEWALISVGPDTSMGAAGAWGNLPAVSPQAPEYNSYRDEYDATNGTLSVGNIYRFRSGRSAADMF